MELLFFLEKILPLIIGTMLALSSIKAGKLRWWGAIKNRDEAVKLVSDVSKILYFTVGILIILAVIRIFWLDGDILTNLRYLLWDLFLLALLAYLLSKTKNIFIGLTIFIFPLLFFYSYWNLLSQQKFGLFSVLNIFLMVLILWAAVQATQATIYLKSRK